MTEPTATVDGVIHVAAAAIVNTAGEVLLARRADEAHQGGLWEFPGGKLEPGESAMRGLRRELREELGIEPGATRPLIRIMHQYDDRAVLLDVHLVSDWRGEPHGREGQPLAWVAAEDLQTYPMPAADLPIIRALQLPPIYLITPPGIDDVARFLAGLESSLASGIRLVQLRLFDLPDEVLIGAGRAACALCQRHDARVLLNGRPDLVDVMGADGLHLTSRMLQQSELRPDAGLLAASCHTPDDLERAAGLGVDFALLSPVLPTRSHPDAEPLGWQRFGQWVEAAGMPVYALGGMRPEQLATAWRHGAQGVAGIRGFWADDENR